jgi:two-component system chemotaxis sensor kinase CheA
MEPNLFYDEILNKLNLMEFAVADVLEDPSDMEKINELFRAMHTIKGIANLLFFFEIESLTHSAEDLLDEIRNQRVVFNSEIADLLIQLK